ncbi:ABC transporter permease [Fodinicola feengrottensis]|uniref:ABC transporter permease n=1 Tax=Fodinicola feengrottensis TaxID=435914 RepID=A0ABN2HHX8_9ACTN|nr:ABC transporter permease [Fodinicola feengrottensis]
MGDIATSSAANHLTEANPAPRAESVWARAVRRYSGNKLAVVSLFVCVILVLAAIFAPLIAPYGYAQTDLTHPLLPAGQLGHLFGTDQLGRDVLSRLVYSLRTAFLVAFVSQLFALALALLVGLVAGYLGGRADQLLMAGTDVMFAFPAYLFTVILVTVFGQSTWAVALAIGIASWVVLARLVRGQVLSLKVKEYVEAGRAMGAGGVTIACRYILPNAVGPILVTVSFGVPAAIVAEAGLALLGLGVGPPVPSWGGMINDGRGYVLAAPHMLIPVTVLFGITVLAFSWVGDGLRDAFDVSES